MAEASASSAAVGSASGEIGVSGMLSDNGLFLVQGEWAASSDATEGRRQEATG